MILDLRISLSLKALKTKPMSSLKFTNRNIPPELIHEEAELIKEDCFRGCGFWMGSKNRIVTAFFWGSREPTNSFEFLGKLLTLSELVEIYVMDLLDQSGDWNDEFVKTVLREPQIKFLGLQSQRKVTDLAFDVEQIHLNFMSLTDMSITDRTVALLKERGNLSRLRLVGCDITLHSIDIINQMRLSQLYLDKEFISEDMLKMFDSNIEVIRK